MTLYEILALNEQTVHDVLLLCGGFYVIIFFYFVWRTVISEFPQIPPGTAAVLVVCAFFIFLVGGGSLFLPLFGMLLVTLGTMIALLGTFMCGVGLRKSASRRDILSLSACIMSGVSSTLLILYVGAQLITVVHVLAAGLALYVSFHQIREWYSPSTHNQAGFEIFLRLWSFGPMAGFVAFSGIVIASGIIPAFQYFGIGAFMLGVIFAHFFPAEIGRF